MELELSSIYEALGVSLEDELSTEQISSAYEKVFQFSVNLQEVENAIKKLYWDFQLLNAGRLNLLFVEKGQTRLQYQDINTLSTDSGHIRAMHNIAEDWHDDVAEQHPLRKWHGGLNDDVWDDENEAQKMKKKLYFWRLKKGSKKLYHRLSQRGLSAVMSIFTNEAMEFREPRRNRITEVNPTGKGLLHDVDEKFEILQHQLYTEMLQEHYGSSSWEALAVWQQEERVEELQFLAEHALSNGDSLCLSELPGAFRIYR
ncbi:uncharacterized protein [Lepisosteus oculatus]|uniref:uncharacterized protein n=1 Tax=Lepisosteus oculatus TaxID=7918 RepID=UPI00371D0C68